MQRRPNPRPKRTANKPKVGRKTTPGQDVVTAVAYGRAYRNAPEAAVKLQIPLAHIRGQLLAKPGNRYLGWGSVEEVDAASFRTAL